eukprot:m.485107 g.485107  ORF g.485107 m.485107 type:complete len:274 (+) comp23657_c0_seq1:30-851(+)
MAKPLPSSVQGKYVWGWDTNTAPRMLKVHNRRLFVPANHCVHVYDLDNKGVELAKFDGEYRHPYAVDVDSNDNLYVTDNGNNRIVMLDIETGRQLSTLGADEGTFSRACGLAVHGNQAFAADTNGGKVNVFDIRTGNQERHFGSKGHGPGLFTYTAGVTVSETEVFVCDHHDNMVSVFSLGGELQRSFNLGRPEHPDSSVYAITYCQDSQDLWVADYGQHCIRVLDPVTGDDRQVFGEPGRKNHQFRNPFGVYPCDGLVYIADNDNNRVRIYE